ncbi:MAG: DUF493 domain-containing protein [Crocinitomicaceae bacterium]|nr:DUF493 domain-containing protein [Crocinitomicaceae bacterium]
MSDEYEGLRKQLNEQEWPNVYLFKFVIPNRSDLLARVTALFDDGTDLSYHQSKTGKYISVSAKEMMIDVQSIIDKYKEAAKIENIMIL